MTPWPVSLQTSVSWHNRGAVQRRGIRERRSVTEASKRADSHKRKFIKPLRAFLRSTSGNRKCVEKREGESGQEASKDREKREIVLCACLAQTDLTCSTTAKAHVFRWCHTGAGFGAFWRGSNM